MERARAGRARAAGAPLIAGRGRVSLGRTAVVVDDGIATGSTARAAARWPAAGRRPCGARGAGRTAAPHPSSVRGGRRRVCRQPGVVAGGRPVLSGLRHTSDEEVRSAAATGARRGGDPPRSRCGVTRRPRRRGRASSRAVTAAGPSHLPERTAGVVVFAHGSGSSRHSPRNRFVAEVLNHAGLGTLLFDLLTPRRGAGSRQRVRHRAARDASSRPPTGFASSRSAARVPDRLLRGQHRRGRGAVGGGRSRRDIAAVVSRGGRPDLAGPRLARYGAPTLLIVGGHDDGGARPQPPGPAQMRCEHPCAVVPGATHLFEEPGTLEAAADLARDWFVHHLTSRPPDEASRATRAQNIA